MKKRIVFFGSPEPACRVLQAFHKCDDCEVVGVVSNPDKPVGRKKTLTPTPVKEYAEISGIPVITPVKFAGEEGKNAKKILQNWNADFFVIVAYGVLVPQNIIDIPKYGAFNLHFSLLPKYRGASPIQSAILAGEKTSGISIFKLVLEMDAGEIFVQEEIEISGKKHMQVWDEMIEMGSQKFLSLCKNFPEISGVAQDDSKATFCGKFVKADGEIFPEKNTADEIFQKFLAFHLWPGIFFFDDVGKRIKLINIQKIPENFCEDFLKIYHQYSVGDFFLFQKKLILKTFSGALEIVEIQKEGKKAVLGKEFQL